MSEEPSTPLRNDPDRAAGSLVAGGSGEFVGEAPGGAFDPRAFAADGAPDGTGGSGTGGSGGGGSGGTGGEPRDASGADDTGRDDRPAPPGPGTEGAHTSGPGEEADKLR